MFAALITALAIWNPSPAVTVRWLDPIDEVAPEVCEHHGQVVEAFNQAHVSIAACADGSMQWFK